MDMLQIYLVFSLKTIADVQYLNKNGHVVKTCPSYLGTGFRIKDQSIQKVEPGINRLNYIMLVIR